MEHFAAKQQLKTAIIKGRDQTFWGHGQKFCRLRGQRKGKEWVWLWGGTGNEVSPSVAEGPWTVKELCAFWPCGSCVVLVGYVCGDPVASQHFVGTKGPWGLRHRMMLLWVRLLPSGLVSDPLQGGGEHYIGASTTTRNHDQDLDCSNFHAWSLDHTENLP